MNDLQQLYQQIILDHAKARHGSSPEPFDPLEPLTEGEPSATEGLRQAQSHQVNTSCGDDVTMRVGVNGALVEVISWRGDGCSISMASASVLSDTLRGKDTVDARATLEEFREMLRSRGKIEPDEETMGDAAAFAGVSRYPARVKCAMLPWVAFETALAQLVPPAR